MPECSLFPLLKKGTADRSVIAGTAKAFDLESLLKNATAVRIAMAFGHESGWSKIETSLKCSSAATVQILLGQAFYRTEPPLLSKINRVNESVITPKFEVKLAPMRPTFHPKVWIIDSDRPISIVGSGNLSGGGLSQNVECGLLTSDAAQINALREWFDIRWELSEPLARTFAEYLAKYERISAAREFADAQIAAAMNDQADKETAWRRRTAVEMAVVYWRSNAGAAEVKSREEAIERMRTLLHYPSWEFGTDEWSQFLRIPELGRIRLTHEQLLTEGLPHLKAILKALTAQSASAAVAVEDLQKVPGIEPNIATKLLAVFDPDRFVVVNDPVESALRGFDYEIEPARMDGNTYVKFLKDVAAAFIEESDSLNLSAAPALDAFFFAYQDLQTLKRPGRAPDAAIPASTAG